MREQLPRPIFSAGQLLTAEDLTLEQNYFREKLKRHNRTLHGFGVISGLRVSINREQIVIGPGLALDCEGNEIVIELETSLALPKQSGTNIYVNVRYFENKSDERHVIVEGFELVLSDENFNRGHRHLRGRWLPCGNAHPLTIAKLRYGVNSWHVDRRYRPPSVK